MLSIRVMAKQLKIGIISALAVAGILFLGSDYPCNDSRWLEVMLIKSVIGFGLWGLGAIIYKKA